MGTALKERTSKIPEAEDDEKQEIADIEEVADIIDKSDLSNTQKMKVMKIMGRKEEYSGPIPHPNHLRQYEEIVPGSGDRLIKMTESQVIHRQNNENKIIDCEIKNKNRGQIFGFILALIGLLGGFSLIFYGKDGAGIGTLIGSVAVLVLAFIYGKVSEK